MRQMIVEQDRGKTGGVPFVIEIAVEPKSKADQEKMSHGLARLAAEDPSFRVSTDQE